MTDTPTAAPRRWSPEEEAQLSAAYKAGKPLAEIATLHGRSLGAITSRLQQMDLVLYGPYNSILNTAAEGEATNSGQPWTEDHTSRLLITHHTTPTPEDLITLATELGRTPRSLALKLVQLGVIQPTLNPNPNPAPREVKAPKAKTFKQPTPPAGKAIKITVTPEFQTALASIQAGENLLILGSAGTGKSTFLKWLRKNLEGKKSYAVLAPTGMAALNVGGQTVHSFFGLKAQLLTGSDAWHKPRNPKVFANLQLLVIDEISMVRADVFDTVDRFLRKFGPSSNQPFGGVQLVLMGDLCQLPPVVRREETAHFETFFPTPFFFSSPAWENGHFGILEFTHIFRQTDVPFISLLNQVRHGQTSPQLLSSLNERVTKSAPSGAVILAARNRTVDDINSRNLQALPGRTHTYNADVLGDIDPNSFTTPTELLLKKGARVMFTRNDPNQRWVNGSLAEVTHCSEDTVTVRMLADGETHIVEPTKWEATKFRLDETTNALTATVAGSFTQIPLTLAWALTIHKAQGQTLPSCVIDLSDGGTFAEGQLYVALSRARALESLHLTTPIRAQDIRTNPAVLQFYRQLGSAS
jgi:energy-coupling factor transporter ATP-binding protein EcfA2